MRQTINKDFNFTSLDNRMKGLVSYLQSRAPPRGPLENSCTHNPVPHHLPLLAWRKPTQLKRAQLTPAERQQRVRGAVHLLWPGRSFPLVLSPEAKIEGSPAHGEPNLLFLPMPSIPDSAPCLCSRLKKFSHFKLCHGGCLVYHRRRGVLHYLSKMRLGLLFPPRHVGGERCFSGAPRYRNCQMDIFKTCPSRNRYGAHS